MSPSSLALAKAWYEQCSKLHKQCDQLTQDPTLPLFVLDVTDSQRPFLSDGENRKANYATLSYKWGQGERFLTTSKNYAAFQQGFHVNELPKTFSDAILVANKLGFTFLWIDALCIRHDIKEEVNQQISMMDSIYAMSSLTIFGAWGETAHSGLGTSRDPWLTKPSEIMIKIAREGHQHETTIYMNEFSNLEDPDPTELEHFLPMPLYERGWVLQEEVLSLRGLVFNAGNISWQCPTLPCGISECSPVHIIRPYHATQQREHHRGEFGSWLRGIGTQPPDAILAGWLWLLESFFVRSLTYPSDALPALSGLASSIYRLYKFTYLAGIWLEDMQRQLLWHKNTRFTSWFVDWSSSQPWFKHAHPSIKQRDTSLLRTSSMGNFGKVSRWAGFQARKSAGPSWSWASQFGTDDLCFHPYSQVRHENPSQTHTLEVIDTVIVQAPGYTNRFGEVEFGMLRIKALVKRAIIDQYHPPETVILPSEQLRYGLLGHASHDHLTQEGTGGFCIGQFYPDDDETPIYAGDSIFCVFCVKEEHEDKAMVHYCLAIVPTGEPGQYVRVGLALLFDVYERHEGSHWGHITPCETKVLDLI
jgi:hypothetical protein